jgi:NAD(P)-dependent dehydrogenase (short-subunit alcohol dehydrogenase family)
MTLAGKTILITGAARRLGAEIALFCAQNGADIIIHYHTSETEASEIKARITALGRLCWTVQADLNNTNAVVRMYEAANKFSPIAALINNASIFKPGGMMDSNLEDWETALRVNLTAPFVLTQAFTKHYSDPQVGRVVNLVDWRALRPGKDHFAYTISKAALVALTKSTALNLAPRIIVNAIALGAILPPENEPPSPNILKHVPMNRWAGLEEFLSAIKFLLDGPEYITGEVIHLDGGRHLV